MIVVVYLTIWTVVDPQKQVNSLVEVENIDEQTIRTYQLECKSETMAFGLVISGAQLVILFIGVVLSVSVRNMPSAYNESNLKAKHSNSINASESLLMNVNTPNNLSTSQVNIYKVDNNNSEVNLHHTTPDVYDNILLFFKFVIVQ
eukprot:Pgem_evm1s2505